MKMAAMKLANTPRPAAWSPPLASFPSTGVDPCDELIQLSPSSCGDDFLVIGGSRMIGSMWRQMRELQIDRDGARSKAGRTRPETPWAGLNGPASSGSFWAGLGPSSSPRLILAFWTLPP
jgi:hypothetical protein